MDVCPLLAQDGDSKGRRRLKSPGRTHAAQWRNGTSITGCVHGVHVRSSSSHFVIKRPAGSRKVRAKTLMRPEVRLSPASGVQEGKYSGYEKEFYVIFLINVVVQPQ